MLKRQVKIGSHYAIRHHTDSATKLSIVRIDSISQYGGYNATKLTTGRTIRIKSAGKLRYEVERDPDNHTTGRKWRKVGE